MSIPKKAPETTLIEELAGALHGATPLICWYISKELIDRLPLATLEALTNEPSLYAEAIRLPSGGCLIVVWAARSTTDAVEEMLGALGALGALCGIPPREVA